MSDRKPKSDYEGQRQRTRVIWKNARQRVLNRRHPQFGLYGGRGIDMDPAWAIFENFARDMGLAPDGETLDRIDPDNGYWRQNCRWATPRQQARNRRSNTVLEYAGEALTIAERSERTGLKPSTISKRLSRGWSVEETLMIPVGARRRGARQTRPKPPNASSAGSRSQRASRRPTATEKMEVRLEATGEAKKLRDRCRAWDMNFWVDELVEEAVGGAERVLDRGDIDLYRRAVLAGVSRGYLVRFAEYLDEADLGEAEKLGEEWDPQDAVAKILSGQAGRGRSLGEVEDALVEERDRRVAARANLRQSLLEDLMR